MKFEDLNIIEPILKAIETKGLETPTPIQEVAIPVLLEKKDVLASAQTGTGKTASFVIPILQQIYLNNIQKPSKAIKALVLTPTRELAIQVGEDFNTYSKYLKIRSLVIFGGVPQVKQTQGLNRGTTIVVATPGRLLDLMNQGFLNLKEVEFFVLDEADQMLDMGFIHDVRKIMKAIPSNRQSLLFSATMPSSIIKLADEVLNDPVRVEVSPTYKTLDVIEQSVYHVRKNDKTNLLVDIIKNQDIKSLIVFSRTKHNANKIVKQLLDTNISAEAIHGNKSQNARVKALDNFKKGTTKVLVATDIAARGLDISGLSHVINYDLPEVAETYIHRIGRTGRAGETGIAISFCDLESLNLLKDIENHTKRKIDVVYNHPYVITGKQPVNNRNNRSNTKSNDKNKKDYRPYYKKDKKKRTKLDDKNTYYKK